MTARSAWVNAERQRAWAFGRAVRDRALEDYAAEYGIQVPPAPALIAPELVRDFFDVRLLFLPLPDDRFGETEWIEGRPVVTVNTRISAFPGVKDAQGVQNVTILHECIHALRDRDRLDGGPQLPLLTSEPPCRIVCPREKAGLGSPSERSREFFAEEAGRAAAVSHAHLARSQAFQSLLRFGPGGRLTNGELWRLLQEAAQDIGVNRSALVRQLELEGYVVIEREQKRYLLRVQPALVDHMEAA